MSILTGMLNAPLNEIFGALLRTLRQERGISQEELAFRADVDRTFISLLERGQRQPSLSTVFQLAQALSVKPSVIIERVELEAAKAKGRKV